MIDVMPTFNSLPAEIRLCIYEQLWPAGNIQSLKPLGFRNPNLEHAQPNVSITLPTKVLMQMYNSNPAGVSKGRFWEPCPLLGVNQQIRDEVEDVLSKKLVEVDTWMSFLSRRPEHLLAEIKQVHFTYWLNPRWSPQHPPNHPAYALDGWIHSITALWGEQLERLYCIMGGNLQRMSIDMTLLSPPMFTYRVKSGLCKESLATLREKMPATLEKILLECRESGKWPERQVIIGHEDEVAEEQGGLRGAMLPAITAAA